MIRIAQDHKVEVRCEIDTLEQAKYYKKPGSEAFLCRWMNSEIRWRSGTGVCGDVKKLAERNKIEEGNEI